MGKPNSQDSGHHLIDDLLGHCTFISDELVEHVISNLKSIITNSTIGSTSVHIFSQSSTDIVYPLISVSPSTDMLLSNYPLIAAIQAKGKLVIEGQVISSNLAKGELCATLVGEGEKNVSQGEPLMQQKRENERKAGTGETRKEAAIAGTSSVISPDAAITDPLDPSNSLVLDANKKGEKEVLFMSQLKEKSVNQISDEMQRQKKNDETHATTQGESSA